MARPKLRFWRRVLRPKPQARQAARPSSGNSPSTIMPRQRATDNGVSAATSPRSRGPWAGVPPYGESFTAPGAAAPVPFNSPKRSPPCGFLSNWYFSWSGRLASAYIVSRNPPPHKQNPAVLRVTPSLALQRRQDDLGVGLAQLLQPAHQRLQRLNVLAAGQHHVALVARYLQAFLHGGLLQHQL